MVLLHKKCERRFIVNQGQTIFSQVIDFLPWKKFRQCVNRYNGNHRIRSFTCYNQLPRHMVGPRQPTDIKWITTKKQVLSCPISHFLTPKNEIYKIAP
ncbi:MAG: DUF4372 domain-containing protein [Desulfobacteraceae bacterium]|nr:DUF4372 domain-containing protein [Desulfobacteraceae bacterium]